MDERLLTPRALVSYVFWALLLLGLFLTSRFSYLLFHSLAGFFSVVIATGVFAINYLLCVGIAYLFVGALDLLYTLTYRGMGVFPGFGKHLPTQLWFASRTLESLSLFLAPQFIGRRLRPYVVFAGYLLAFTAIILVIFFWPQFPAPLLTAGPVWAAFKQTGDYVNSVILAGALVMLWRWRQEFDPGVLRLLLAAVALALASEVTLTFIAAMSAQAGLAGHLLKIASLYLIYRALIVAELIKPYHRLFHNLRLSEAVVQQEKDFADRLMEMAQVMVLVLDAKGRILRLNHRCEAITGYTLAEVKDRPFWEVFPAPEEVAGVQEAFFDLIAGDFSQSWQIEWVTRNGRRRLIAWSNTAFPRENGAVEYVIGTGIDISEQREVEKRLQQLNGKLEQQIRKEPEPHPPLPVTDRELDRLNIEIFNDFRVPVRWIRGYCRALEEHSAPRLDTKGREYLRKMQEVIRQMGELVEALLQQARLTQAEMHRQRIDLSDQARLIAAELQRTAPDRQADFIIEPGLSAAGDPTLLRSVLQNLLGNSWKCTKDLPRARIEFGALPTNNCHQSFFVRDNRSDLGPNYVHLLFRSFQRLHTARDFSGSDLKLATVRSIILRHGGRIWAEGELGRGVTFFVTLPTGGTHQETPQD
ncbi:MAG: MASE3 domain-containing protein [Deltaproteobacteria bacterium]